MIAFAH